MLHRLLRTLVQTISSTPRVFVSGCGKARFAGNSGAIDKKCNAAAAAHEQPNVEIILTRVLSPGAIALMVSTAVGTPWAYALAPRNSDLIKVAETQTP
jgi:hypothetical protein